MKARLSAVVALLLVATACAVNQSPPASSTIQYRGKALQRAEISGLTGSRTLVLEANGDPSLGAGMPADCELHATEDRAGAWRLVPFESEIMRADTDDIAKSSISLNWLSSTRFVVATDFDLCGVGIDFNGIYRASRKRPLSTQSGR